MSRRLPAIVLLCGLAAGGTPVGAQPVVQEPALTDEVVLKSAGLPLDGTALIELARLRAAGPPTAERLRRLIDQLGSEQAAVRDRACFELIGVGPPAIPALRQAVKDPDAVRAAAHADRCLDVLEKRSASLTMAAVRLLGQRKPPGAVEALLGLLPVAEEEQVIEEVQRVLAMIACRDGKVDPALAKALAGKSALCRSTAIDVLARQDAPETRPLLRQLLRDPAPGVRFRVALALAMAHYGEGFGALTSLLADLPIAQGRQAEDFLAGVAGDFAPKVALADDDVSRKNCRDAWERWWRDPPAAVAPAALVEEVRKRCLPEPERIKIQALVDLLGDENFGARERASGELKALGKTALPLLMAAARSRDLEVSRRASALLEVLEEGDAHPLNPAVCRLLALRKPPGAVEALLAYVPLTESEAVAGELQAALGALAAPDDKPDPVVLRALADNHPLRRAAAAEALCQARCTAALPAVRKLLKDQDAAVRARVAQGLVQMREAAGVPVLIALLTELPADQAGSIEDFLHQLAGDKAPAALAQADGTPQKRQDAWAAWWAAQGNRVELPDRADQGLPRRHLGYTLLVQPQNNQVCELDQNGKVRWQINNLSNPQDAQMLPGDRVLIAEYGAARVTERNVKGEILWQKQQLPGQPINVQRLPGGNTLIALRDRFLEVDRNGREVFTLARPQSDLMTGTRLRDGKLVCISNQGVCHRLDRAGKELANFRTQGVSGFGNEVLPNGNVLIPLTWQNKVTEYGPEGKVAWEVQVQQPWAATRLPNGHTLVSLQQWPPRLVELDKAGKQVGEIKITAYTVRVRRR